MPRRRMRAEVGETRREGKVMLADGLGKKLRKRPIIESAQNMKLPRGLTLDLNHCYHPQPREIIKRSGCKRELPAQSAKQTVFTEQFREEKKERQIQLMRHKMSL